MSRIAAVLCVGLGLAGVSIALGFLYIDFVRREGAWVELQTQGHRLEEQQQDELLAVWEEVPNFMPAMVSGTLGVALLGSGLLLAAFQLPLFNRGLTATDHAKPT